MSKADQKRSCEDGTAPLDNSANSNQDSGRYEQRELDQSIDILKVTPTFSVRENITDQLRSQHSYIQNVAEKHSVSSQPETASLVVMGPICFMLRCITRLAFGLN